MTPNELHRSLLDAGHSPGDAITYYTGTLIPAGLYRRTGDRVDLWDGRHLQHAPWIDTPRYTFGGGQSAVNRRRKIREDLWANKK